MGAAIGQRLKNQVAIVTGASSGIGAGVAHISFEETLQELAAMGYQDLIGNC
jgi:NADP-dependent 3-hydroxy acid dehydrogenase YdfG